MIRELFLPTVIRGRRYFSEYSLGISINETTVRAAVAYLSPAGNSIVKLIESPLTDEDKAGLEGKLGWQPKFFANALKSLVKSLKPYDIVRLAIPSSLVVIKEIELPFCNREKIKMVIEYEAEPLLPFPAGKAVIDFIVTGPTARGTSCRVLIAAARQTDIQKIFELCTEANLAPHRISLDLFSAYGLILMTGGRNLSGINIILTTDQNTTSVVLLENGALRFIHNIPIGTETFTRTLHEATNIDHKECQQKFARYGVQSSDNKAYDKNITHVLERLIKEAKFAIDSFNIQLTTPAIPSKIILIEKNQTIKGLDGYIEKKLAIPCKRFSVEELISSRKIQNKATLRASDLYPYLTAIGTAIVPTSHEEFNIGKNVTTKASKSLVKRQFITSGVITVLIAIFVALHGYLQLSDLSHKVSVLEQSAVKTLKTIIPKGKRLPRKPSFKRLTKEAEQHVAELENIWGNFGNKGVEALENMLELTRIIDRNKFDIVIEHLNMSKNEQGVTSINFEGTLKTKVDYLKELEELANRFRQSKRLALTEFSPGTYDESTNSTQFSAKMLAEKA